MVFEEEEERLLWLLRLFIALYSFEKRASCFEEGALIVSNLVFLVYSSRFGVIALEIGHEGDENVLLWQ